ncbi:MAG: DUF1800 domain-containing protein [Acidobacteria bacterium]|nr:DUF1800 domain-containing protein [Acidobacteriota bacterium]
MTRRLSALLFSVLAVAVVAAAPRATQDPTGVSNDAGAVRHALNRLTFGPRPGDVERVQRLGLAEWIDQQLEPARPDDRTFAPRLPRAFPQTGPFDSPQQARRAARAAVDDLAAARLLRAVASERQLEEVLVDFWFNHFNVFAGKGRTAMYLPDYEREAIRPHVLGRFRDLLGATARHPAMLFYLDNWLSVDPAAIRRAEALRRPRSGQPPVAGGLHPSTGARGALSVVEGQASGRRRGLNENYARELLELHTLGVDGGYTQRDVVEVARAFTGWTIAPPAGPGFRFAPLAHDGGEKVVLGHTIAAGGAVQDGERVLDILAAHPSTARHIATKLARRFVSDDPPEALVARTAARFRETDGDLREVVRAIVMSPEFFAREAPQAKVKTPLEFVVSAVRAAGTDVPDTAVMARALRQLGMPLYMCAPPTGYDDTAETWVTSGGLVTRINLARQLAGSQAALVATPEFQRR